MHFFKKIYWILSTQLGIDPRITIRSMRGLFRYLKDFVKFNKNYNGRVELKPCLHDWYDEGGSIKNEYFWQDLLVAQKIFDARPEKHIDIGSRIDGFVAHVASFREIEVFDVRPIAEQIPRVKFQQADLMKPIQGMSNYCDSLSCLHALEHFGLGRYGDPIQPDGFRDGVANMANLLREGGRFYLSVPIGLERVEFNANRVFDPRTVLSLAKQNQLMPIELTSIYLDSSVNIVALDETSLTQWETQRYALGIFVFEKTSDRLYGNNVN
jgi:Caenorhabditis protein of unknown function, DUF268.